MLALIGALGGIVSSLFPAILKYLTQRSDQKHEREMFALQTEYAKIQHEQKIEKINVTGDIQSEIAVLQAARPQLTGSKIVDGILALLNSSVRPVVTYIFVGAYMLVKYAQFQVFVATGMTNWDVIIQLWNSDDMACFMCIIGHWFGARMLKHAMNKYMEMK